MNESALSAFVTNPKVARQIKAKIARQGVPRQDRDDVTQLVWMEAITSFIHYDPARGSISAWLNSIIMRVVIKYRSKNKREVLAAESMPEIVDNRSRVDDVIASKEIGTVLHAFLMSLVFEIRWIWVIREHYLEGVPMSVLAKVHHIGLSTLYKRRNEALLALQSRVREHPLGKILSLHERA